MLPQPWRHYPLAIAGLGAVVGCSSLLGLGSLEKVDCVQACDGSAGALAGGAPNEGGGAPAEGGTAGSDSGGSAGSAGSTENAGAGGARPDEALYLIDDFSDCNSSIIEADGRKGAWFNLSNLPQYAALSFGPPPSAGWTDKSCGAFLTGMCQTCSVIGFGVTLADSGYDLSKFSGFRFTYETESTLFASVEATNGQTKSYATSAAIAPSGTESVATVLFSSLNPEVNFAGFAKADAIRFTLADKTAGFGVAIHRLELLP